MLVYSLNPCTWHWWSVQQRPLRTPVEHHRVDLFYCFSLDCCGLNSWPILARSSTSQIPGTRPNAAAISIWVLSVILLLFCLLSSLAKGLINIVVGLCFIITAVVNCRIYFAVRDHKSQIQVLQMQVAGNSQVENAARQRKSAVSTICVCLVFLTCCLPKFCATVAFKIYPSSKL